MVTGATKNEDSSLLMAWSGNHLQWLHCQGMTVLRFETIAVADSKALRKALLDIKSELEGVDSVQFATDLPYFSMAPSRVALGREKALQTLHLGGDAILPVSFYSEAFGEEASLIEQDLPGFQDEVEAIWPRAKRVSMALMFLESVVLETRKNVSAGCVAIHVGHERALMALFAEGGLMWSMTTDDMAGDGILYHVVNAIKRQERTEELEMEVLLTGQVEENGELMQSFNRFFERVEVKAPEVEWERVPSHPQHASTLTRMLPCA